MDTAAGTLELRLRVVGAGGNSVPARLSTLGSGTEELKATFVPGTSDVLIQGDSGRKHLKTTKLICIVYNVNHIT